MYYSWEEEEEEQDDPNDKTYEPTPDVESSEEEEDQTGIDLDRYGYPKDIPKPKESLIVTTGKKYTEARKKANAATARQHKKHPEYKGKEIHHIHPVGLGGDPEDSDNMIALSPKKHRKVTKVFNEIKHDLKK